MESDVKTEIDKISFEDFSKIDLRLGKIKKLNIFQIWTKFTKQR